MKFFLTLLSICLAQNNFDFDPNEIALHLRYKGGVKNLVTDLLTDYGFPTAFVDMFNDTTDASIIASVATYTDNIRNSIMGETVADTGLFSFYVGLINSMTLTTTYTRQELEANVYTGSLETSIPADADLVAIMDGIVTSNYDPALAAAVAYAANATSANMVTFVANVNRAVRTYSSAIGMRIPVASSIENIFEVLDPIMLQALFIWENLGEIGAAYMHMVAHFMDFTDYVIFGSIADMCDQKVGAFGMIHQMAVRVHGVFDSLDEFKESDLLQTEMVSMIFFGETGHKIIDWYWYVDTYILQYTNMLAEMGGEVERNLNLYSLILDPYTFPFIYNLVKTPICGIE